MNNHTVIQDTAGINAFYAKIYSLVGVGLGISAVVSALMLTMFQSVIVSGMALKNSPMALPLFLVYSALNGFTLSVVLALYTQSSVLSAFVTASAMFFAMAFVGKVTKKDLSGMGRALRAALFGLIIASVVNIFLGSGSFDFLISIAGVIIFSGLIAWDNQKIRYVYEQTNGQVENGWAISMALNLYLDFINLFLSLLRLFGRND